MLREIYCEEFHQKKIEFYDGFNVVLGTNDGDNSIGKSTFMLIIDFVYGGNAYSDSSDIIDNLPPHYICFKFEFNKETYYFSRSNTDREIVWKCDSNYVRTEQLTNNTYCEWLSKQYNIDLYETSLRTSIGRYIRVYGKNNCSEKLPLNRVPAERNSDAILALIKLFNRYKIISEIESRAKKSKEALDTYTKAQSLKYISKINKKQYDNNIKEIMHLEDVIKEISSNLEYGLVNVDAAVSEEAIQLKKQLSREKRLRNRIRNKLSTINENTEYKFSFTSNTCNELMRFFPNINIKQINEIETFHMKMAGIFKNELSKEKDALIKQMQESDIIITDLENKLKQLIQNPNLSQIILQRHADALKEIDRMEKENEAYLTSKELRRIRKDDHESLKTVKNEQLGFIEKSINTEMEKINNKIYKEKFNAPIIHFTDTSYSFITPNDTGTGIAYKGLVVFDLAILRITKLPILVHDSVVLKQISDNAIENIVNQYIDCKKQVIIALDKQNSYSEKTCNMLEKYCILKLAPNGQELFGRSWGKEQ